MIPIITLDGPSGVGKSTISQQIAEQLGWHFLDSGALYRVVAFQAQQQAIAADDIAGLVGLASKLSVSFQPSPLGATSAKIILDEHDVSKAVRSESNGIAASKIAIHAELRAQLLTTQRQFSAPPGLVADGRDMGTVVFPQAPLKCFLTATTEARALRRVKQLQDQSIHVSLASVINDLEERDQRDQNRDVAPLKPADDAITIDTTALSITQVLDTVLGAWQNVLNT